MSQPQSRLFQHPGRPEWGRGLLVAERDKLLVMHWEDGKEHLVAATHRDRLNPVELPAAEQGAVVERIKGMLARSTQPAPKAKKSTRAGTRPAVPLISFAAQAQAFEAAFPQGFEGAKFVAEERGVEGDAKPGQMQWAIESVRGLLAAGRFGDAAGLFDEVVAFLRPPLDLVHPMEGAIPLKSMKDETARAEFIAALRELIHGAGDFGPRFDAYVASIRITSKDGKTKRPGWPLATLLPALHDPAERLFVKPQLMQKQAAILGLKVNYQSLPSAAIYQEFLRVARAVETKLRERSLAPRDLLDVSSFVVATLSPNQPGSAPLPPAVAPVSLEDD